MDWLAKFHGLSHALLHAEDADTWLESNPWALGVYSHPTEKIRQTEGTLQAQERGRADLIETAEVTINFTFNIT